MRRAPSGYQFSRDAFDLIGREKFGEAWTGDLEYRARSGLWTIAEYEKAKVTPGSGMRGSGAAGIFVAPSTDDPASETYQAEREARERYEWAEPEFIARLESGHLAAFAMDPWSGKIKPIGREFWRTSGAKRAVNSGKGPDQHWQSTLLISVDATKPMAQETKKAPKPSVKATSAKRAAVHQAAGALYGSIAKARSAPTNARDAAINKWLTQQNLGTASSKTIHRALEPEKDK
ncbi:hypothetical protein M2227_003453 [Bradyrhizobium elkanii]|uniref:hypothetical protein n=1 Tax=Bradyrhizobium elkanii TaxID=29448 RepID=UPI0022275CEE|nr:hypothetical protein [Bradyrhizobium elkanii]MCW2110263.1 hypothetical protein [Bradyrhizobium elkanii]MCW2201363.1 hypothetical protein [Bradyrhizobium elkanii]MCW2226986.1 hypothetical protein [Bradyrhizobium elkanii]WLB76432.1 hypothetical protein QIH89_22075 [Bradyrhizobium elkanii]